MAQKSGFFNALLVEDEYDRKYNADDYSDNLAVVIGNGVLRSENDDLKVTASGMVATVAAGRGWINGHYFINTAPHVFAAVTAPIGGSRYDRIMLRLNSDISARSVSLVYVEGTSSNNPVKPAPTRSGNIFDLVLCDIYVAANATSVAVTDTRSDASLCGWVYSVSGDNSFFQTLDNSFMEWFNGAKDTLSSVTLFKKFSQVQTLAAATQAVSFNIPQYDADTCFVEVYVNGIFDTRHTIIGNVITFVGTLVAGTVVTVNVYKSIDGTGIMSVADEITELQNAVSTIIGSNKFSYTCTGLNDNISLSQIAQAINAGSYTVGSLSPAAEAFLQAIGGNTFLASLTSDAQITIDVVGKLGVTTPHAGSGTTESRFRWFSFGVAGAGEKRIVFDFAKCDKISVACAAGSNNIIFYGTDLNIRNANVLAHSGGAGCTITMIVGSANTGNVNVENCRMKILTSGKAIIAHNGNFRDCTLHVKSSTEAAYCFDAKSDSLVRAFGGTYFAYTGTTSKKSAIFNTDATETNAVTMAQNINAPTIAQDGYYQNYLVQASNGMTNIATVVTLLVSGGVTAKRSITGYIQFNKR